MKNLIFQLLWSVILIPMISASDDDLTPCGTRMRKSWDKLNRFERRLYLEAVDLSMQSGDHLLFAQVHVDPLTEVEAHATCGFTLWHRKFLLAYENMLRRQAPTKFRCLTLPYWDVFSDSARMSNHECTTLEGCSRVLRDLGGSQGPNVERLDFGDGRPISGACVSQAPLSHFCSNSNRSMNSNGTTTSIMNCGPGCIPRGNWTHTRFPSGFGLGSLAKVLSEATDYRTFTSRVQMGMHNSLHNAAGGTLGTMWSPADPVFYLLHATIDMLHHLYYECHVGRAMSREEKRTNPLAFQSCVYGSAADPVQDTRNPTANSSIYMHHSIPGQPSSQDVHRHARLGTFFRSFGTRYYHWIDTYDLRTRSYGYHFSPLARALVNHGMICPSRQSGSSSNSNSNSSHSSISSSTMNGRRLSHALAYPTGPDPHQEDQHVEKMLRWFNSAVETVRPLVSSSSNIQDILDQLELMECQYHAQHFGGVEDYSNAFRYAMHLNARNNSNMMMMMHTRCWIVLEQLRTNTTRILVPEYEALVETHFPVGGTTRCTNIRISPSHDNLLSE